MKRHSAKNFGRMTFMGPFPERAQRTLLVYLAPGVLYKLNKCRCVSGNLTATYSSPKNVTKKLSW